VILTFNPFKQKRSRRWWAFSILAHVALIFVMGQIMFRFPIGQLLGLPKTRIQPERITYVAVPKPSGGSATTKAESKQPAAPAPLQAPVATPSTVTTPPPVDTLRSQAAGGRGTGLGVVGDGAATGIVPRAPDPRIPLIADEYIVTPPSTAQFVDSLIQLAIGVANDSLSIAAKRNAPPDWTVNGPGGKWGMDPNGNIKLGKVTLPAALLALLPLNVQSRVSPIEQRAADWVRRDIQYHAQVAITEDEFRAAVKRIRERKEKERQKQIAEGKTPPSP
jgi:hypothetical protein